MEIIDSHTHAYPEKVVERAKENLQKSFSRQMITMPVLDNLYKYMDEAGISKSVIASVASRPDQVLSINNWLFSIKDPRVIAFASMHPYFAGFKEELKRIKDNASGIKLQSEFQLFFVDEEKAFPMYEELQKLEIPVLFHCGVELSSPGAVRSSPERILNVMNKFPHLKIIGAHMGGYLLWEDSLEKLAGKNIYFDTSDSVGNMPPELLDKFFAKHGYDKILFGSDFPLEIPKKEVDAVKALNISQENKEKIFAKNIKNLLKI
ncbi:amidohydrolase family protein [Endomicrobium proavitum]|uniref:Amidohydrolase 2 n=1 Tax=Endomicrobium proavitum TaxID=1408281 RepID=A0A0G3WK15_9BACT|nr:amidohydrolase family protein [Endomicrobium proavitum]AKL98648.1 Amidohydrolase 2 [Endomicrobium proavitum]